MKKYEVPAILNRESVKFIVSVPDETNNYQIHLLLMGKYKNEDIIVITEGITPVIDLDFT